MYTRTLLRTRKHLCISWDAPGNPTLVEVAHSRVDVLWAGFPFRVFIPLYQAWKGSVDATERTRLYAQMRDLHQEHGINKKSLFLSADSEMRLFGEYVLDMHAIRQNTRDRLPKRGAAKPNAIVADTSSLDIYARNIDEKTLIEDLPEIWVVEPQQTGKWKTVTKDRPIVARAPVPSPSPHSPSSSRSWRNQATKNTPAKPATEIPPATQVPPAIPSALWPYKWGDPIRQAPAETRRVDFSKEQAEVTAILRTQWNEPENSLSGFGWVWRIPTTTGPAYNDLYYKRSDGFITKAVLHPRDTDKTIVYWPPEDAGKSRTIYLLSSDKKVIGWIEIGVDNKTRASGWEEMLGFRYSVKEPINITPKK